MTYPKYYEVGYRLLTDVEKTGAYSTPYFDIPAKFDRVGALATEARLRQDFGALAEVRVVEVY